MRRPRSETMDPSVPGMFHITSRCVRGAFLYGKNKHDGKDYSHRREYIEERLEELTTHFAIAVSFNAIMDNHLHLVMANLPGLVKEWTDEEVIKRVCNIFVYKFKRMGIKNREPTRAQVKALTSDKKLMKEMRSRLSDPSWFMKQLLYKLAVDSNREDGCKGHFVEKRFDHKVITSLRGLVICGIYVDLNQLAAMEVDTPEKSMHTSAGRRIAALKMRYKGKHAEAAMLDGYLLPIHMGGDGQKYPKAGTPGSRRALDKGFLELTIADYLRLLDDFGRVLRKGKRGRIGAKVPPILARLGLDAKILREMLTNYDNLFSNAVGCAEGLAQFANAHDGYGSREAHAVAKLEKANQPSNTGRNRAKKKPAAGKKRKATRRAK